MHVEEHDFFSVPVRVFRPDHVLSSVVELRPVDDERVIVARVPLHVLDALPKFLVVVVPRQRGLRHGYHPARELDALALVAERALRLDDEPRGGLSSICGVHVNDDDQAVRKLLRSIKRGGR